MFLTRRSVLSLTGKLAATVTLQGQAVLPAAASLRLDAAGPGPAVPADFIGVSYDAAQLADATFFSPANVGLVQQFRNLAVRGTLRFASRAGKLTRWQPAAETRASQLARSADPGQPRQDAITPEAIRSLRGFLDAAGWSCIYGLQRGPVEAQVAEARFVCDTLGTRLQLFQIGDAIESAPGGAPGAVPGNVETGVHSWLEAASAVQAACPAASFGLPDVASDLSGIAEIADRWAALPDRPHVVTLSHHYFAAGSPADATLTAESLLRPDTAVAKMAGMTRSAADRLRLRYRVTEGNIYEEGGKPGVSDVFAAALWAADYTLQLMQYGYSGANLAAAIDRSVLTPIGTGLKFAGAFAGCRMLRVSLTTDRNVTAYAARRGDGKVLIALLNKEASRALAVTAPNFQTLRILTGRSLESQDATVSAVVSETSSRRTSAGQTFILPPHFATLIALD